MLVVETNAARYEEESAAENYEEHLLERVSSLENHLARFAEKLERTLDLLGRQARSSYLDHLLLDTLLSVLNEAGMADRRRVERAWRERFERETAASTEDMRRATLQTKIKNAFSDLQSEMLVKVIDEAFQLFNNGKESQGVRALERAASLAQDNAPLNTFLGEHFFRQRKTLLARDYLSRAFDAEPDNLRLCLLLGLVCGDEGEAARAKSLLSKAVSDGRHSFAAHYALGRLYSAEADWQQALIHFKQALTARKCPEIYYVLGVVNYQLGRFRIAQRHLQSALKLDEDYPEAHYLLAHVYMRFDDRTHALEEFRAAESAQRKQSGTAIQRRPANGRMKKKRVRVEEMPLPAFFIQTGKGRKRLLTGGDKRLAAALCEDALADPVSR